MRFAAIEKIREFLARKPFQPFRIVTQCGQRHEILDRTKIAVTNARVFAYLPKLVQIPAHEIELVYEPRQLAG